VSITYNPATLRFGCDACDEALVIEESAGGGADRLPPAWGRVSLSTGADPNTGWYEATSSILCPACVIKYKKKVIGEGDDKKHTAPSAGSQS
jgi:hypothetical protein